MWLRHVTTILFRYSSEFSVFEFLKVPPEAQGKARNVQVGIKDNGGIQKEKEIVSQNNNHCDFS